jgi:Secretion system C-terminal sorting domain
MKYIVLLILIINANNLIAQESKRNNVWTFGYYYAVNFDFNNGLNIDTFPNASVIYPVPQFTFGGSNICDTNGKLAFASNSYILYNSKGLAIDNWENVNCPFGNKLQLKYGHDGFFNQMSIILPKSGNQYYVFTTGMSDKAFDEWQSPNANYDSFRFDNLNYAIVDMDANNGLGKVVEKNKVLLQNEYLSHNRMTAVKHANGRDWWLVKPHKTKHKFYSFLVSANEIQEPIISEIDGLPDFRTGIKGQSVFNNNGNMYAYTEYFFSANYYLNYFDRCSGIMKPFKKYTVPTDLPKYGDDWSIGVAFSPNDSLLYVTTLYSIFQIDIFDTNAINYIKITEPDTLLDYFPRYGAIALAPNGKIYIGNKNGTLPTMGFIDNPNIKGLGCNFRGRGNGALSQPFTNLMVPPNMPNYGLGALSGSPCDTIRAQPSNWVLYPNPASNFITVVVPNSITGNVVSVHVYDMLGKLIYTQQANIDFAHEAQIALPSMARGVYIIKARHGGDEFISRFVKE